MVKTWAGLKGGGVAPCKNRPFILELSWSVVTFACCPFSRSPPGTFRTDSSYSLCQSVQLWLTVQRLTVFVVSALLVFDPFFCRWLWVRLSPCWQDDLIGSDPNSFTSNLKPISSTKGRIKYVLNLRIPWLSFGHFLGASSAQFPNKSMKLSINNAVHSDENHYAGWSAAAEILKLKQLGILLLRLIN